jgi:hypothetical protein
MTGDGTNTYINRPTGGTLYFREGNGNEMTLSPGGAVGFFNRNVQPFWIRNNGLVGVATFPLNQFEVAATATSVDALHAYGANAASGSGNSGSTALYGLGGAGDPNNSNAFGGDGVYSIGGGGPTGGNGIVGNGGNGTDPSGSDGVGGFFVGGNGVTGGGVGVAGIAGGSNWAGVFQGPVDITGDLDVGGQKNFKIDHPTDPANKYLVHSTIESWEMLNIYTGNITTDALGEATVRLPVWFEALNTDFRYQLTVIGQFAQAIIAREIEKGQFTIRSSMPNVKVSWQVSGVRQDAYAKSHPLVVEQEKEARLRGYYIHPELYGAPQEKQIEWARHPELMKQIKEQRVSHPSRASR